AGIIVDKARMFNTITDLLGEVAQTLHLFTGAKISAIRNVDTPVFNEWRGVVEGALSSMPDTNRPHYEGLTNLITLDTIVSRQMLDTLKRNEKDNIKNMITYVSLLSNFPANTPGCSIAKEYFRKYGTHGLEKMGNTSDTSLDSRTTWDKVLYNIGNDKGVTKAVLADLSKACVSFLADVERVKTFSDVVVDCVNFGNGLSCSESVIGYARDPRGANALIHMATGMFDNLSPPPEELGWILGGLVQFGAFFSNLSLLLGSFRYVVIVAIIGLLSMLMFKFNFIFSAIKLVFRGVLGLVSIPVRLGKRVFGMAMAARRSRAQPPEPQPPQPPEPQP
ncbi:MAG: hypothetical protein EBV23_14750, partial [Flavobacteriia bacterium]|nr:hypothetical protein [Flavobacteriia bacterium]